MKNLKKLILNKNGMTLVEVLVAIILLTILTFVFVPFINNSFKGILLAGELHEDLAGAKSVIDEAISKEDFFIASSYPLNFEGDDPVNVDGTLIANGSLATFLAFDSIVNFESGLIQEGYASIMGTFDESDTLPVQIIGQSIHLSDVGGFIGSQIVRFQDKDGADVNVTNPNFSYDLVIHDSDSADILIESSKYGLDNAHSPYEVFIETRYGFFFTWRREVINVGIEISLPTYMALGTNGVEEMSSNAELWLAKSGRLPNITFNDITWGNQRFVAIGDGGNIYYLKDQQVWTLANSGVTEHLEFVKYLNGSFIAGGANGRLLTSPDGVNWTIRNSGVTDTLTGAAYGENIYMLSSDESINTQGHVADFLFSSNLSSWSVITEPDTDFQDARDIEYDGSKFVAVGATGSVLYSKDTGSNWFLSYIDNDVSRREDISSITINMTDKIGVLVGDNGLIYTYDIQQEDILTSTFTRQDNSPSVGREDFNDIVYSNGYYIAVGNNEKVRYSIDGITWDDSDSDSDMGTTDIMCIAGRN